MIAKLNKHFGIDIKRLDASDVEEMERIGSD